MLATIKVQHNARARRLAVNEDVDAYKSLWTMKRVYGPYKRVSGHTIESTDHKKVQQTLAPTTKSTDHIIESTHHIIESTDYKIRVHGL